MSHTPPITKRWLAKFYKLSLPTLRKNLVNIAGLDVNKRKFTPKEFEKIKEHMG